MDRKLCTHCDHWFEQERQLRAKDSLIEEKNEEIKALKSTLNCGVGIEKSLERQLASKDEEMRKLADECAKAQMIQQTLVIHLRERDAKIEKLKSLSESLWFQLTRPTEFNRTEIASLVQALREALSDSPEAEVSSSNQSETAGEKS